MSDRLNHDNPQYEQYGITGDADHVSGRRSDLLFKHFCNNLYLGQWQLARASIPQIQNFDKDNRLLEILKDVSYQPYNRSILSPAVSSPCKLAWLSLLECEKLQNAQDTEILSDKWRSARGFIQFHLLLLEVCPIITDNELKELYLFYKWTCSTASTTTSLNLSSTLLKLLQTVLSRQPCLGHELISSIYSAKTAQNERNNKALLSVYINAVNVLLDNFHVHDLDIEVKSTSAEKVYEILSYLDHRDDMVCHLHTRSMFSKILDHCKADSSFLNKVKVTSILIGHSNKHLLTEFCRLDYELKTNNAVAMYQICAELTEEQRWLLHLSSLTETSTRWKLFLLLSMKKKKHLLEVVMETGLSLIKCNMYEELNRLMEPGELHPLKPLLLLLGWTHCCSTSEARQLLKILWNNQMNETHPAIEIGCNKLAYQIDLIQWCLEKAKPLVTEETPGPQFRRAADLYKGLESHSVLYMLHNSTRLSALDQQEVLELLQKVPLQGQSTESVERKPKTVRFKANPESKSMPTSLDQKKDMAIYSGYCVLKNVMDVILFCVQSADHRLSSPVRQRGRMNISNRLYSESGSESETRSRSESNVTNCDIFDCDDNIKESDQLAVQNLYDVKVTAKLKSVKTCLMNMQPLTFRLEVIEDVFSLLFLTHEDVQEIYNLSEYNSGDEMDDKSRCSTGLESPQSPLKGNSLEGRDVSQMKREAIPLDFGLDYDIPFEEVERNRKKKTLQKEVDMEKVGEKLKTVKQNIAEKMTRDLQYERFHSSENRSSMSTSSSVNLLQLGLIVNEYLIRDMLTMLKECVGDLSSAKYHLYGNKADSRERYRSHKVSDSSLANLDTSVEEALCHVVKSSVSMETIQKRFTQLEKFVSEALWRFQIVCNRHVPKTAGQILSDVVSDSENSDNEVELQSLSQRKYKRLQTNKRSSRSHKDRGDNHQSDSSIGGGIYQRQMSRSLSRSHSIVSLMLAAPVTLLTMSIRKGQHAQTKQIIKLFKGLEREPETVEVYFSQAFQKANRSVQGMVGNYSPPSTPDVPNTSLKSVANIAAAGVATASISSTIDELLEFPTLPMVPKLTSGDNIPHILQSVFKESTLALTVLLDLLCCSSRSWDVCNHFIDAIQAQISKNPQVKSGSANVAQDKPKATLSSKQRVNNIKKLSEFFHQVQNLIQLGAEAKFQAQEQTVFSKMFHKSVQYFFCQAVFSLSMDKCKQYVNFCLTTSKQIHSVQEAFSQYRAKTKEGLTDSLQKQQGLSDSFRMRSDSKQDKPTIHHNMKQLIHLLEKEVPVGGIKALIVRQKSRCSSLPNKNFILSLYEHCKELAYLVAESDAIREADMVTPKNFFENLKEGPLRILGRMMFTKKMPPAKLEKVAEKLSLNLTHIIVYSCCVRIPSKRLPLLQVAASESETKVLTGKIVYNCGKGSDVAGIDNPVEFLQNKLMSLVKLMKDIASRLNAESLFDQSCAVQLAGSTEFNQIISELSALQGTSLEQMDHDHRKCFYGNLQTFMTVHCHVHHIGMLTRQQSEEEGYSERKQKRLKLFDEMAPREQISLLNTFCYRIGQIGVVSLFELKYQLNRWGLKAPSEWGRTLEYRLYPMSPEDPWYHVAPRCDPLLLFAVTTCGISSPPLQILIPETVTKQLDSCMAQFLQMTVQVDKQQKLIKIPEVLLWHRRDFLSDQVTTKGVSENEGLIAFFVSHLSGEKEKHIKELMALVRESKNRDSLNALPYDIEVIPSCKSFMCVFDFESIATAERYQKFNPSRSNSAVSAGEGGVADLEITHDLTPNTLEYIKSDCPLVATLVSLVCSDQVDESNMDDTFDETFFNVSGSHGSHDSNYDMTHRERAASSMSVVDMKSYRYEKLTYEYPALKRHLLNFIVPLAATEDHDIYKGADPILKLLTSEIVEKFKSNMLSLHESAEFQACLTGLLNELFSHRKWNEILSVIDSVPVPVLRKDINLCSLRDFVIMCLTHAICSAGNSQTTLTKEKSEKVCALMHELMCADLQARELLAIHETLEIEHNMDLFYTCLSNSSLSCSLRKAVEVKYKQIKVFYRVTECAKSLQIKMSLQTSDLFTEEDKTAANKKHLILDKFTKWRTVVEWTQSSPGEVLALLIKTGDFETAFTWCELEKLGADIKREIEEKYFISLLNTQPPDTTKAFMILEKLKKEDPVSCTSMCRRFVDEFSKQKHVMFVTDYILNHLSAYINDEEKDVTRLTHVGSRMILSLPVSMHQEYTHLVSKPRYILEQLIMNMKADLAGKAFGLVQDELNLIINPSNKLTNGQFNTLVSLFAKKALEFTVIQEIQPGDKERTFSVKSTSSDREEMRVARDSPLLRLSPQPRQFVDSMTQKRRSVDFQTSARLIQSAPTRSVSPAHRSMSNAHKDKFVMPAEPPPRDQWVPDSSSSVCMVCKVERFSMFTRRHHCRRCGRLVCAGCSARVTPIKGVNARTCDDCYSQIVKSSDQPQGDEQNIYHTHQHLSGSSITGVHLPSVTDSFISTIQEERTLNLSDVINHSNTTWKLQLDHMYNTNLREDFFFEQAPSTSLCIAILNVHDNPRQCGQLILNMCDDLSQFLKPIAPGVANPEVDYNLIMSMMKYLLFHAKMKFTNCGDNVGMGKCDMYQGLVDLLGLLVVDNYRDLPSIQELTKMDSVRRLRDKLIENERLSLAMDVSTKCGLDPAGVWVTWGMMCLQGGNFTGAREKFSKCLKPPKDKNISSQLSKILTDVIECLEAMPGTGSMEIQVLLANPGSIKNLIMTPSSTFFEETSMDSEQFQESVYYLRTYGNYLAMIDFLRRHGYYMKAAQYILDHRCSTEVFIEGLLRPSIEMGEMGKLTDQMLMIDPSLEKWNNFMTAACRYLVRSRLPHVLYEFQLFMKDYIRAGMSCFSYFYEDGAQSYFDLAQRIQYLFTAQQHMQAYLDPSHWGNVQHPLSLLENSDAWNKDQGTVRLVKTTEEVKRYIKTIALQIEVTKFIHTCLVSGKGEAASMATKFVDTSKHVPTLFGNSQARNELSIMILLGGEDIATSFTLATRIIKEYKLGAVGIYTHVAREMAKNHCYSDMHQLLQIVESSGMDSDETMDEILGACLLVVSDDKTQAKEAENIIKLLRKDANKINAYILCGKLRSAYLMAVKESRVDDVKRILRAAKSMGQNAVITICKKWLEQHDLKQ